MNKSNIEWTGITWNPTTGCSKVSNGCKHCYAERWANMQKKRGIKQYENGFDLTLAPSRMNDPFKWKIPQLVFVNSMSDLLHEKVPDEYLTNIFDIMNQTPQHTYQVLTKRIERLKNLNKKIEWSDNIWLGVSVESNDFVYRIKELKGIAAKIKFISFEPLLSNIDFKDYEGIDWVLVGGESGGKARNIEESWVLSIKKDCEKANVPFFFKQWGKRIFNPNQKDLTLNRDHPFYAKGGCMIKNTIYREYPIIRNGITDKY